MQSNIVSAHIFYILHVDIWGSFRTPSIHGYIFYYYYY